MQQQLGRIYLFQQNIEAMRPYKSEKVQQETPLIMGYYPIRGRVQICRLLCQYLHVPYIDNFFTPEEWRRFKEGEAKEWVIKELPFCQDGDFIVTGPSGIVHYLVEKVGRRDLFGKTITDQIKIDSIRSKNDLRDGILSLRCSARDSLSAEERKSLSFYWRSKIEPILLDYQKDCPQDGWYYGYLTLLNLVQIAFPLELNKFKRLLILRSNFILIPEIAAYENSERALKEYCPVRYFSKFKEERMKSMKETQGDQMQIQ